MWLKPQKDALLGDIGGACREAESFILPSITHKKIYMNRKKYKDPSCRFRYIYEKI